MDSTKKTGTRKTAGRTASRAKTKPTASKPEPKVTTAQEPVSQEAVTSSALESATKTVETPVRKNKKIPNDLMVTVVSNVANLLHYNCVRSYGEEIEWSAYGDSQELSFEELRAMKGRYPRFFRDNWIALEDSGDYTAKELYAALGVGKEYENSVSPAEMEYLLSRPNAELKKTLESFSEPLKKTVYDVVSNRKDAGQFDSISKFEIIKEAAGMSDTAE